MSKPSRATLWISNCLQFLRQLPGELWLTIPLALLLISVWVQKDFWQASIFFIAICLFDFIRVGPKLGVPGFYASGISLLFLAIALGWGWLVYVGTAHRKADIATIVIAWFFVMAIGGSIMSKTRGHLQEIVPSAKESICLMLAAIGLIWISLSVVNGLLERSPVPMRTTQLQSSDSKQGPHQPKIAIALSGGGYRAALFHAGVLDALAEHGISFQAMSTVSGGSIFGAFYAIGGEPKQFLDAVVQGRFNLKRELLRFDNAIRLLGSVPIPLGGGARVWPFESAWRTSDVHAAMLDRLLFRGATLAEVTAPARPELMICATDLLEASALGILPHGVIAQKILELQRRFTSLDAGPVSHSDVVEYLDATTNALPVQPISKLVAASGAFPAALSAIGIGGKTNATDREKAAPTYLLADGGLIDNFGIRLAYSAIRYAKEQSSSRRSASSNPNLTQWDVDVLVVSDGSAYVPNARPRGSVEELQHGIELMYQNSAVPEQLMLWQQARDLDLRMLWLNPRSTIEGPLLRSEGSSSRVVEHQATSSRARHASRGGPSIALRAIPLQAIDFLAENMRPDEKVEMVMIRDHLGLRATGSKYGWESDITGSDPAFAKLVDLLNRELSRRFEAFASASTLVDNIEPDIAMSIYKLGQYVGLLNLPSLAPRNETRGSRQLPTIAYALSEQ
jgi:predicted acylesterase/phospholipase RssA